MAVLLAFAFSALLIFGMLLLQWAVRGRARGRKDRQEVPRLPGGMPPEQMASERLPRGTLDSAGRGIRERDPGEVAYTQAANRTASTRGGSPSDPALRPFPWKIPNAPSIPLPPKIEILRKIQGSAGPQDQREASLGRKRFTLPAEIDLPQCRCPGSPCEFCDPISRLMESILRLSGLPEKRRARLIRRCRRRARRWTFNSSMFHRLLVLARRLGRGSLSREDLREIVFRNTALPARLRNRIGIRITPQALGPFKPRGADSAGAFTWGLDCEVAGRATFIIPDLEGGNRGQPLGSISYDGPVDFKTAAVFAKGTLNLSLALYHLRECA